MGETLALLTALSWAISTILFKRRVATEGARSITFFKCLFAAALFWISVALVGASAFQGVDLEVVLWLTFSGTIGLALGDTALFAALHRLGAQRTLLLQTTAPMIAATIAFVWPGERLGLLQVSGIGLTVLGVASVVGSRRGNGHTSKNVDWAGISIALLAATGQAVGLVLSRYALGLTHPSGEPEFGIVFFAMAVRLTAAVAILGVLAILQKRTTRLRELFQSWSRCRALIGPSFIGTYLGLVLFTASQLYAKSGVVAALSSTTPIFALPLAWCLLGEKLRPAEGIGTIVAVSGVALLLWP